MKKIAVIVVALIVLVAGAIGAKLFLDYKTERDYQQAIDLIAQGADVSAVSNVLSSKAPMTWVYDRDMNLLMTLKVSDAVQAAEEVPDAVRSCILSKGDVAEKVALAVLGSQPTEDTLRGYIQRYSTDFTQDQLVLFLASTGKFGNYSGLTDAASNFFGVQIHELTEPQQRFLAYAYDNEDASVEDFLTINTDLSVTLLGTANLQAEYRALRELIIEEMQNIPGVDMRTTSYNVQVTLSTQQQNQLQVLINDKMKSLIDLNGDGTYAVDCSAIVIDNNGRIRAYAPRRSTGAMVTGEFKLNGLTFVDNLVQLIQDLSKEDECWLTLRKIQTANGDTVYRTLEELFNSQTLGKGNTTITNISARDVVTALYSQNVEFPGFGIIHEVQTLDGNKVFTWPSNRVGLFDVLPGEYNVDSLKPAHKVYEFFSEDKEQHTKWGFTVPLSTGVVSFHHTSNYIVAVVVGTGALGGGIGGSTQEMLQQLVASISETVGNNYPTQGSILWPSGFEELIAKAYSHNAELLAPIFVDAYTDLTETTIDSVAQRKQWESLYQECLRILDQYKEYLSPPTFDDWKGRIDTCRKENSELLLRYSA